MDKEKALQLSSLLPGWNLPIPGKSLLTKNADSSFSIVVFSHWKNPPALNMHHQHYLSPFFTPRVKAPKQILLEI